MQFVIHILQRLEQTLEAEFRNTPTLAKCQLQLKNEKLCATLEADGAFLDLAAKSKAKKKGGAKKGKVASK